MEILKEEKQSEIEYPWMKKLDSYDNSDLLLQAISDSLFDQKSFHINSIMKDSFLFYGEVGSIKEYINKIYNGNIKEFIKAINSFRDIYGIPLQIEFGDFRVIASDEELEFIFNNQNRKPIYPESCIKGNFTYES